ncbi:MAG: hypothetical protein ACRYFS_19680 [Janthinobacterium lividum]
MKPETVSAVTARMTKMRRDNDDILAPVRQKLLGESQQELLRVPKDLNTNFEKQGGWAGAFSGATAGAVMGAHVSIITLGTGLVATVPLALIGGVIGYFGGAKVGSKIDKDK